MTTVAVLADPPRPGLVLPGLAPDPLSPSEAADLYGAMLRDVLVGADAASADLLVNYRPDDLLPDEHTTDTPSEAALRAVVADAVDDPSAVRIERQVGSTQSARIGNTVTHLLREEGETSVGVVRPTAPFFDRTVADGAAMKLRSSPVVLGPAPDGRVHYAAFTEPIDFEDAFTLPELTTLVERGRDAGHDIDFVGMQPLGRSPADLATRATLVGARSRADRSVPSHTARTLDRFGIESGSLAGTGGTAARGGPK